jgi:hypothetical protein
MPAQTKRKRGEHGHPPLSKANRRRLLSAMMERAQAGDNVAATALVLISLRLEQAEAFAGQKVETSPA